MNDLHMRRLDSFIAAGDITLGRGEIISKDDIESNPGPYPIYSSSAHNNGKFGEYGEYIFNEELITWSVDGGGNFFYRPKHKYSVTNVCGFMRINNKHLDARFIYYVLLNQHRYLMFDYTTKAHPSVIKKLYYLPEISLKHQLKIATIFQTIDQAIEKTEVLIKKYRKIKTGLMHDLFTRGIGSDGKLRPSKEQVPELYKETPIGWIPKVWDIDILGNLLAALPNNLRSGPFGSALLKSELVEEGIPFLGIDNIHVERFVKHYRRHVSEEKFRELSKYAVRPKDVVITIMGTVGRCAVIPNDIGRALSSKHLWTLSLNQELVIPELVCWQLNYASWVKKWFRKETQGGIMDAIQSKTLRTLRLPVPPLSEQKMIFERYKILTSKINNEIEHLEKLVKIKNGLMHDLLTGEVPVKIDEAEVANV